MTSEIITHSPEETIAFGRSLAAELSPPLIVLLRGNLGAGKTTLVKGIAELVDDDRTGILVLPKNATALADAFQRLGDDPALRQRMGRAGREKIAKKFSLKANTAKRASLFLKSIGSADLP